MTTASASRPSRVARLGDAALWIGAVAGALCVLVALAAFVFHLSLIMFKTGSMEPTIPTGSVALVREVPASDLRVGDIVTIDRPGMLPITHRVTSVQDAGATWVVTMRGDANPVDDPEEYRITTARTVVGWIPGLARIIVWFSNPFVLGALTLAMTGLIVWAFWPRDEKTPPAPARPRRRLPRDERGFVKLGGMTIGLALAVLSVAIGPAPPAQAAEVETVVTGTYLQLTSISDPDLLSSMTVGNPVSWQVGVDAFPPDPGTVHIGLGATGTLTAPGDWSISVRACASRWVGGVCAGGGSTWVPTTDLAGLIATPTAYGAHEIGSMDASAQRWLLMAVTLTSSTATPGQDAAVRLQAWGVGAPLSTGPNGALAHTGSDLDPLVPLALAASAVVVGIAVARFPVRRRRADD